MLVGKTSHNSFRYSAGCPEDDAGSGSDAERHIRGFKFHIFEHKTGALDHSDQFTCRKYVVDIRDAVCLGFVPQDLSFFSGTRHDGNGEDFLSFVVGRIFVVFSCHCSEHLHRRACCGKVFCKFRVSVFTVADPSRAAGREQRQIFAGGQPLQKFFAFLDHGQIRAVSCVEDFIEAHAMEHVDDLAHHVFALWQIEGVADSHSYCRSDLRDDFRVRISQCFPYRIHIGIDADRSSRAYDAALSASYAVRRVQQLVECRSYRGRCSAGCEGDGIDSLRRQ